MINPTVGRIVHVYSRANHVAAIPSMVRTPRSCSLFGGPRCINVRGYDGNGTPFVQSSLALRQPGDPMPESGAWAEWMPYQVETAKAAERQASSVNERSAASGVAILSGNR